MPVDHLVITNMQTGFETDRPPFIINNDAFPRLIDAYIWRGKMPRKRGTYLLGRLERELQAGVILSTQANGATYTNVDILADPAFNIRASQPNAQIVPTTVDITVGANVWLDLAGNGVLTSAGGSGTINYATGALSLTFVPPLGAPSNVNVKINYFPVLPVMGLEEFDIGTVNKPITISFDTRYSYGFNQGTNLYYDVTFYKSTGDPFVWNGQDYQQFYSANYLGVNTIADSADKTGCLWVTNGDPGFQFITITNVTVAAPNTPASISTITTSTPHNLTNADFVFINEVNGINSTATGAGAPPKPATTFGGINGASGQVTVTGATTFTLPTPYTTAGPYVSGGIVQYMTQNSADPTGDGIKWYDGDPTVSTDFGWVNFAPPLNEYNSVTNPNPFYLVGADIITPFKNRLIFSGVRLTTTLPAAPVQYFPNRIVYSQVGTPFYAKPLPFAINTQAPDPAAWFQNVAGRGGFLTAPYDEQIIIVSENKDILTYGTERHQLKLVYTLDDSLPFIFQTINSELGSQNTFSAVSLDTGVLSVGDYGILMTTEYSTQRIDLQIPDQVFEISVSNNNNDRVTAIRDFRNEWVYFTYCPGNRSANEFPSQTLLYNYRDNNWAIFNENYTHYGPFRRSTFTTWASIGSKFATWSVWDEPWNSGENEAFYPNVTGGTQHGFVMVKGIGTGEGNSQVITDITVGSPTIITSPAHSLQTGDFINIMDVIGVSILDTNGNPVSIFEINVIDVDNFDLFNPAGVISSGIYIGGGVYSHLSRPEIQTKQFPVAWEAGRGVRVGTQRYLLETTSTGQITAQVFSSQNADDPSNDPGENPYLVFENVVFTSPEPDLYGANPAYAAGQAQIWHRQSNSFNGSTVQMGFTLSPTQMFDPIINQQEIILHAIVLDLYPGQILA